MAAVWNRVDHYIFILWFLLLFSLWPPCVADADIIFLSNVLFLSFFLLFSSPNLSGRRMHVYHTSTHDVVLVRVQNAGLKCAARWKMQDPITRQKSPSGHHRTTLAGYIFATKARIDNRKKNLFVKQQLHMSAQYGELRPING